MSKNIEVVGVTKKQLRKAILDNLYWQDSLAPLPKSKAIWLVSNTRIDEDDYCGVMGYEDGKMVSFVYMFPDYLNTKSKELKKVYWLILWWVNETYKNTVLGNYTYTQALNLANKQVLVKAYAENVNSFYEKQPYKVIASRDRHTIFFSLDTSILIGRFPVLKSIKFLLSKLDNLTYVILKRLNKGKLKTGINDGVLYDYINELDNETWKFIKPLCKNDLILKTKEYINWQINNAQYTQTPNSKQSYASLQAGCSSNIHIHNIKIMKNAKVVGFLSFTLNYNEYNVKYFLVKNSENYNTCVDVLIENLYATKAKFIFTDDLELSNNIKNRYKTIYTHKVTKKGLAHNDISVDLDSENLHLFNRDGHFY